MHPVLFKIGEFTVHSYYILWAFALSVGVVFTRSRANRLYGLDDDLVRKALFFVFLGMLIGARIGGYSDHWAFYARHPEKLLNPLEGALSSTTAFAGGGIAGIIYCIKKKIPLWKIADAASIPAAATVAIGRVGCFLNGCCLSFPSDIPWGVHFPNDPAGLFRHPVQLYYSGLSLTLMFFLFYIEKWIFSRPEKRPQGAVLWPLFMIFYGIMRFSVDFLREGDRIFGFRTAQIIGLTVVILGAGWLFSSIWGHRNHRISHPEQMQ